mmetsp:Transcript_7863/g.9457  ORF Transcript_7863/g.9457 Transcript_7863/m.9457 type:complete len:185 (-) Transcript_7863:427-981(-)
MDAKPERRRPNILITGTPGVGKTTTAKLLAERLGFVHICVGDVASHYKCYEGRDDQLDSYILDDDQLIDAMEPLINNAAQEGKGVVADFHMTDVFPERYFDLVLVLRTTTEILFDRLTARGYSEQKRSENMQAEIMQVILEEARGAYAPEIVHDVPSNTLEDMESNVSRIQEWARQWVVNNGFA